MPQVYYFLLDAPATQTMVVLDDAMKNFLDERYLNFDVNGHVLQ